MNSANPPTLERTLESAVIVSWADLMKDPTAGLLHLEYTFGPEGSLDYLKVWSSITRGEWHLICAYWTSSSAFHNQGIHFEDGFRSDGLSRNLEFMMQHQHAFSSTVDRGRTGLLQIQVPTADESTAATESLRQAFLSANAIVAEPAGAALAPA
jgi:hypothetical protein